MKKPDETWEEAVNEKNPTKKNGKSKIQEETITSPFKIDEMDRLKVHVSLLEHELLIKDLEVIKSEFKFKNKEMQMKGEQLQKFIQDLSDKYEIPFGWSFDTESFSFVKPEDQPLKTNN